ncbi:MAG: glycosyltransferase family 2 protein [Candidatus Taylorbacteria bacterium]|nr:glycosyltransferase family 2 protein [Candidatus Taylorbacteria bacterium]
MKVSIVIPAYNEEGNIAKTIEAVLAQDYPNYEVIVVNNASTDKTAEIASRYSTIKVVDEPIKGILSARERGRITATGDLIANIDADCLPDPDWITRGVAHFIHDGIVGATGPYDYYDGHPIFRRGSLATQKHVYHFMSKLLQSRLIKRGAILIGGNNLIRAKTLAKAGGYTTAIKFYGEDTDTARKIARHGRIVFNPKFSIKTSARRFKEEGTIHLMLKYWYHFFKHILK